MCGKTYGVARNCRKICAIRVLGNDGSGYMSWIIAGVNYVAANAPPGSVVNMSLGGGKYDPLNTAINDAVTTKGVVFVVAAGNESQDACLVSPASASAAITVAATDSNDVRATFSNFGNCVDLFAPGTSIKSAWIGSTTASNTISGTSMAAPHVAGLAMMYREQNPYMAPAEIRDRMLSRSVKNVVTSSSSTNAHLAVVPTLKCGPCNEDGQCQVGETTALCPFENCGIPNTCKTTGFACTAHSQCCSLNCRRRKGTCA
jgi:serine protease